MKTFLFPSRPYYAFTLVEMVITLVVIAIVSSGVMFMTREMLFSRAGVEKYLVSSVSVAAARYSRTPLVFKDNRVFNGSAVLFLPNGHMVVLNNNQEAYTNTSSLVTNAYEIAERRIIIALPQNTLAVGIDRTASGLRLLSPPFAVQYKNGIAGSGIIRYDMDGNGLYQSTGAGRNRLNPFGPSPYTPRPVSFEEIEIVVGVYLFNTRDFQDAGLTLAADGTGGINAAAEAWIKANGTAQTFGRYGGLLQ
jgi:prepilin-type N-terminal cleavage/methylation domain-containing protein